MRLDRWLATLSVGSRSEVKQWIRSGRAAVDGRIETDPSRSFETETSRLALDGKALDGRVIRKNTYDPVVVHGKAIRREWLREHRIRFPEDLTWCEDSAMLAVCEMELDGKRKGYIRTEAPIYAFIARKGSLCNRPEILYENRKSFWRRHCYVQREMEKRGLEREARMMTARNLGDAMYTLEIALIADDMSQFRAKVRNYYRERRGDLARLTAGEMREILDAVNLENRCHIEAREFWAWLKRLNDGEQGGDGCLFTT